ncbi:MAG: WD40 repeat domain-containing protein [Roseomonas sp.]|nr:WD40 repeat domain-containing protein [Roseomonas sp.]MCA3382372.1 WD40 repeat domain-containing protein [Roseomonas sp.]
MASLTRRAFGLAGMGALAGAGAVRPVGASWLGNLLPGGRGMTESGGVRLKQIASVDVPEAEWVRSMAWSPDGSRLVAASYRLNVFDTATWSLRARFRVLVPNPGKIFGFSADGREVVASRAVETPFSVFETDTGKVLRDSDPFPISIADILGQSSIPDILGQSELRRLWQVRDQQSLTVSPDGHYIIIILNVGGSRSNVPRLFYTFLFDSQTGRHLSTSEGILRGRPAISRNNCLAVEKRQGLNVPSEVEILDLPSLTKRLSFPVRLGFMQSLSWSPEGDRLASGMADSSSPREQYDSITIWNATSGERIAGFESGIEPIRHIDWHPSGRFIVSTSAKGTGDRGTLLQLLPAGGGEPALRHLASGSTLIRAPCFCPRTARLAWNESGKILIHEIQGF